MFFQRLIAGGAGGTLFPTKQQKLLLSLLVLSLSLSFSIRYTRTSTLSLSLLATFRQPASFNFYSHHHSLFTRSYSFGVHCRLLNFYLSSHNSSLVQRSFGSMRKMANEFPLLAPVGLYAATIRGDGTKLPYPFTYSSISFPLLLSRCDKRTRLDGAVFKPPLQNAH